MYLQDYELTGRFVTAAKDVPMYAAYIKNGEWKVAVKPYDFLRTGKTFPHRMGGVTTLGGERWAYSEPIKGASGLTSSTYFPLSSNPFSSASSDVMGKETQYGQASGKFDTPFIKKLLVGLVAAVAATYLIGIFIKGKLKA